MFEHFLNSRSRCRFAMIAATVALSLHSTSAIALTLFKIAGTAQNFHSSINGEAYHQISPLHQGTDIRATESPGPAPATISGAIGGSSSGPGSGYSYAGSYSASVTTLGVDGLTLSAKVSASAAASIYYDGIIQIWDIHQGLSALSQTFAGLDITVKSDAPRSPVSFNVGSAVASVSFAAGNQILRRQETLYTDVDGYLTVHAGMIKQAFTSGEPINQSYLSSGNDEFVVYLAPTAVPELSSFMYMLSGLSLILWAAGMSRSRANRTTLATNLSHKTSNE